MKSLKLAQTVLSAVLLSLTQFAVGKSPLKEDESVLFFPTSASVSNGKWDVRIHSWVFEKEEKDLSRIILQKSFEEVIEVMGELDDNDERLSTLNERLMWFLVDNQRNKGLNINFNNQHYSLESSEPNGHAITTIKTDLSAENGDWLSYKVEDVSNRNFGGEIQLIPETGLSIISDIDDTIKVSNVLDKKELILNTFINPYITTEGFPDYYKKLALEGAYFHYVSASPWQLYPSLKPFMDAHYPKGTLSLRNFRLKDSSLLGFLKPSTEYKISAIKNIIERYSKHQFILIGDSGEHDPGVYAEIYRQFPENIQLIQIRAVEGSDLSKKRFSDIFKDMPLNKWELFSKPVIY